MSRIFSMAIKDLRLLSRDKLGTFFILGFPVLMGLFFGMMLGGPSSGGSGKMRIAIVDQDQSTISKQFVAALGQQSSLLVEADELDAAKESVRKGNRIALIVLPVGFGETAGVMWESPPKIRIGVDPSRSVESAMLQGMMMEGIGNLVGQRFQDTAGLKKSIRDQRKSLAEDVTTPMGTKLLLDTFLGSVDSMLNNLETLPAEDSINKNETVGDSATPNRLNRGFNLADIESIDVSRQIDPNSVGGQLKKIRSTWDISFPQAMMWGVLGCVAGFSISIARERSQGTMLRLQVAPVSQFEILAGKALACFLAVLLVIGLLTLLGVVMGMSPNNYWLLAVAAVCVGICFVGIMMTMSLLGKTEQSVSGAGWAINMVMAMLGGAMIPVMFMPAVIQQFSVLSPIKWGILAIEGAIWRQFSWTEMMLPCGMLLAVGAIGFVLGMGLLKRG